MTKDYTGLIANPTSIRAPKGSTLDIEGIGFIVIYSNPKGKKRTAIYDIDVKLARALPACMLELRTTCGVLTIYDGGFYNPRAIRGSTKPSMHAYGLAFDAFGFWVEHLGKKVTVSNDWKSGNKTEEGRVLRQILKVLRKHFRVIGPDALTPKARRLHSDHLHCEAK